MTCFFLPDRPKNLATPLMLMLLLSVAPLVKMISLGSAPIRLAMYSLACSTACSLSQPYACVLEWGLPNTPV